MATNTFRLQYLAKAAAGVPRDLVNTFISAKVHPIRPTVLIYNCTWVCDAQCTMCNNWKLGDRKSDMTLAQLEPVMAHPVLGRGREPEHLRRRADDAERSARDGGAVPPAPAPAAQDRHQHHGPDAASRDPDADAHRRVLRREGLLISIRVSLDGIGDIHNQVRHVKNGFDKASKTIEAMQALAEKHDNFQFGIAATIFATNMEDAREHPRVGAHEEPRRRLQHAPVHRRDAPQQGARGEDRLPARARKSSCGSSSSIASRKSRC